jgi:hypothetical protein
MTLVEKHSIKEKPLSVSSHSVDECLSYRRK